MILPPEKEGPLPPGYSVLYESKNDPICRIACYENSIYLTEVRGKVVGATGSFLAAAQFAESYAAHDWTTTYMDKTP